MFVQYVRFDILIYRYLTSELFEDGTSFPKRVMKYKDSHGRMIRSMG